MSFDYRPASRDDIARIHELVESAYRGEAARAGWTHEADLLTGQRTDPESLAAMLDDPAQHIILCSDGARLAGCVAVAGRASEMAYLGMLTVRPDMQSQALGRMLMQRAEVLARDGIGARSIEMTVIRQRPELIAYYQRRGYALTGEVRPFPHDDIRFGVAVTPDLEFVVLSKVLV